MRFVSFCAALLLAGCAATAPTPTTPATPAPNRDAAQQVDPGRLRGDLAGYAGWNVLVWGTARDVRPDGTLTLVAYGPNLARQPLPVALPPATPVAEGGCYYVYATVAGGVLKGYAVAPIVAGDKLAVCGT